MPSTDSTPSVINDLKAKLVFSGHESFQCRQFWLKKGFDYIKAQKSFADKDAVVRLGVGKNMVSAIRFWLRAFGIVDSRDVPTELGTFLFNDEGWDPFLEDEGSYWLLHYQLVKTNFASIYSLIFNEFRRERLFFDKESFLSFVRRKSEIDSTFSYNEKTIAADFDVFVKMYQMNDENNKDIEDSFTGILSETSLLQPIKSGKSTNYQILNRERDTLPNEILLYSILDNDNYGNSINMNSLEYFHDSPGSIFALDRSALAEKLIELLDVHHNLNYTDQAGVRELQFKKKLSKMDVLRGYYGK